MAKEFAKDFYGSGAWKKCRKAYVYKRRALDGGMCELCHERLGYIVHHVIALTPDNIRDPEVALNHSNLQFVCKACHDREEGHFLNVNGHADEPKLRCSFDSDGNPVAK